MGSRLGSRRRIIWPANRTRSEGDSPQNTSALKLIRAFEETHASATIGEAERTLDAREGELAVKLGRILAASRTDEPKLNKRQTKLAKKLAELEKIGLDTTVLAELYRNLG